MRTRALFPPEQYTTFPPEHDMRYVKFLFGLYASTVTSVVPVRPYASWNASNTLAAKPAVVTSVSVA